MRGGEGGEGEEGSGSTGMGGEGDVTEESHFTKCTQTCTQSSSV